MFHFVANLKPYTLPETTDERFDAYLLSADYTRGLAKLAAIVRAEERVLVADNGNMDVLRKAGAEFAAETASIDADRRAWEQEHRRYARPKDLPEDLQGRFRGLAHRIAAWSETVTTDDFARDAVTRQLSINPSMVVGMEDLTLATMGALNVEPEYAGLPTCFYENRARRAVTFARRTIDGEFGSLRGSILGGLHGLDYDSSVLAGRIAAEAGLDGITLGMFGALTDRNYVDFRVEDGHVIELPSAVPRPYLRVIELSAGVLEGFRRAGRPRPAFHALGVGTPILLPLLSLLGTGERYFATDSTAPIVDGWSSPTISLYVTDPAPLKYKAYQVADSWIRGGRGWDCECPHCARFRDAHPPDLDRARQWWRAEGEPHIEKEMLERNGPLSGWLPFLAYPADKALRTEAGLARVGHNHWALRRLELEIRKRSGNWLELANWVQGIVNAYRATPTAEGWKVAVAEAYSLARKVGERLAAAAQPGQPGPSEVTIRSDAVRLHPEGGDAAGEGYADHHDHQGESVRDRTPHESHVAVPPESPLHVPVHRGALVHGETSSSRDLIESEAATSVGREHDVETHDDGRPREDHDQVVRHRAPHVADPTVAPHLPVGVIPLVVAHESTLAGPPAPVKLLDSEPTNGYHGAMAGGELLLGYGEPITEHGPSQALLLTTLEKLRKTESCERSWQFLQPLATDLAGLATALFDALAANTTAVTARLDKLGEPVDTWREALAELAGSESEEAQAWRAAVLAAATEELGAAAEARVAALLGGDATLLRLVELGRDQAKDTYEASEFTDGGFSQFHDLFADDSASIAQARTLALSLLEAGRTRGLMIGQVLGSVSRHGIASEWLPELGPIVVRLSECGARLRLLVAYSAHVVANSHSLNADAWLAAERAAANRNLASDIPTGAAVQIADLSEHSADDLVEVKGRIAGLTVGHDPVPPKFSTFVKFVSFDGGASVQVRAHMFNLQKNGLREGALCKIRGFIRRGQPWLAEDETGLDVDRVSLSKLRKTSWLDDLTYRMRPFYRLYQDEMSLFNTPGGV